MTLPQPRRGLPPGVIVIAGPDGSGKSSLAGALAALHGSDEVLWLHHRPRLLPSRTGGTGEPVTDPYGQQPYPPIVGAVKVVYYWLDYVLGWALRVRPLLAAGGTVVLERGWADLAADPRRYRLHGLEPLVRTLERLLPSPTCTFLLTGPPDLLLGRTGDNLTRDELAGQLQALDRVLAGRRNVVRLDVREPVHALVEQVLDHLEPPTPGGWAAVPRRSAPRWLLPRTPRRVAAGALRIHRPMTPAAAVVWHAAVAAARCGAARLVPAAPAGVDVPDEILQRVPRGGAVAVARSNHPGRHHALVVDGRGRPVSHVKVATDPAGVAALAREAENLAGFAPSLTPPLSAPALLHHETGVLVTAAVAWGHEPRPWQLDPSVAAALGRLWQSSSPHRARGAAHGDVAPWNLLPTAAGWVLVDWEMALPDAPPFFDLLHWLVMSQAHLRRPGERALQAGLRGDGWIGACVRAYADAAGVAPAALQDGVGAYLEATVGRSDPRSPQGRREEPVRAALRITM